MSDDFLQKKSSRTIRSPRRRGDPAGIRTPDPLLKRQLLCRLSYRVMVFYEAPLSGADYLAGTAGLEPADEGVKVPCLTTWLHPCVENRSGIGIAPNP